MRKKKDRSRIAEGNCTKLIRDLMQDGKPRTANEIAEELDMNLRSVRTYLRPASKLGPNQEVHSVDRASFGCAARYVWGKGANVKPRCDLAKVKPEDLSEDELDARHKNQFRWWPQADLSVIQCINAMVRTGAA